MIIIMIWLWRGGIFLRVENDFGKKQKSKKYNNKNTKKHKKNLKI